MKQLMRMGRFNKIINKGKLYHGDTYVAGKCLDEPPLTNLGLGNINMVRISFCNRSRVIPLHLAHDPKLLPIGRCSNKTIPANRVSII